MKLLGLGVIVLGAIYLIKPEIFRKGFWMKTSMALRFLSPEAYPKVARVIGAAWVLLGIYLYVR